MTTTQIIIVVAALAIFALCLAILIFGRRQRVTLEPPPTEKTVRRTFERTTPATPAVAAPSLAVPPVPAAGAFAPPPLPAADARLTQIKGLGPKAAAQLAGLGIASLDALAALDPTEAETIDAQMGSFKGRMVRDRWVEQARLLVAGDRAGFEATFGRLGSSSSPPA